MCRECGRPLQEEVGPAPLAHAGPVAPTPAGSIAAPEPEPELPHLALPPRGVPWSLRCEALFGGFLNQVVWFFLGACGAGACLFVAAFDVMSIAFEVSRVEMVEGTVTSAHGTPFADDDTDRIRAFRYRFVTPEGKPHGGRSYRPVSEGRAKPGQTVTVEYLAARPSISRIKGMRTRPFDGSGSARVLVFVFLAPMSVFLTAVLVGLRRRLRVFPLLGRGQVAEGTVASRRAPAIYVRQEGTDPCRFTYAFRLQGGEVRTIARVVDLASSPPERVAVLYDERKPKRAALLSEMLQRCQIGPRGYFGSRWPPHVARLAPWLAALPAFASLMVAGLALVVAHVYREPRVEPPAEPTLPTLHEAAAGGDGATVKLLIEQGARVDARDDTGRAALDHAVRGGHAETAELLLANNADVRGGAMFGSTALHDAVWFGNSGVAEILLQHGADVNARNHLGATPLHVAARRGRIEVAKLLLEQGADVNAKDNQGKPPLLWALSERQAKMAEFLRAHGGKEDRAEKPEIHLPIAPGTQGSGKR